MADKAAMTSNRPYRAAMEPGKAIDELRKHSGSQFDHDVVESLARLQKQGKLVSVDRGDSW